MTGRRAGNRTRPPTSGVSRLRRDGRVSKDPRIQRHQNGLLDAVCAEYEQRCVASDAIPSPFETAERFSRPFDEQLLTQLILVAIDQSVARGQHPCFQDWLALRPDAEAQIREAFQTARDAEILDAPQDMPPAPTVTLWDADDFVTLELLSETRLSQVHLARDLSGRLVALKISDRQSREPHLLRQLDHPHIVRMYDYRRSTEGRNLISMEFVPSISLGRLTRQLTPRSIEDAENNAGILLQRLSREAASLRRAPIATNRFDNMEWPTYVAWLGERVASALDYAHARGVLHRDVKPENILVQPNGEPKLIDFNVSHGSADGTVSPEEYFGGSLPYMAPEHLDAFVQGIGAERVREPADVWSLGVVLYELLVGKHQRPIATESTESSTQARAATYIEHANRELSVPDTMTVEWQWLLRQCRAFDPDQRPTMRELRRRLEFLASPELQQCTAPHYPAWVLRRPDLAMLAYVAFIFASCFAPNAAAIFLHVIYNALLNDNALVGALWNPDRAWLAGPTCGTFAVAETMGGALLFIWPAIRAITTADRAPLPQQLAQRSAARAASVGMVAAGLAGFGWLVVGLGTFFYATPEATLAPGEYAAELATYVAVSLLHGLLTAPALFVMVTHRSLYFLVLRLTPRGDMSGVLPWFPRIRIGIEASRSAGLIAGVLLATHAVFDTPADQNLQPYFYALAAIIVFHHTVCVVETQRLEGVMHLIETLVGDASRVAIDSARARKLAAGSIHPPFRPTFFDLFAIALAIAGLSLVLT